MLEFLKGAVQEYRDLVSGPALPLKPWHWINDLVSIGLGVLIYKMRHI